MSFGLSQRIASELGERIESGEWSPDRKLPSTRALAAEYAVSLNTVQNAYRVLEGRGLVVRHPRRGGFVAPGLAAAGITAKAVTARTVVLVAPAEDRVTRDDQWSYRIIRAAEAELSRHGHTLALWSAYGPGSADGRPDVARRLAPARDTVAGAILLPFAGVTEVARALEQGGVPWVSINRLEDGDPANTVTADHFEGGRLVGRCFARAGYRHVAYLGPLQHPSSSSMGKFQGFLHGCLEAGLRLGDVDFVRTESALEPGGVAAFTAHLRQSGRAPRAVFAAGDLLALAVLRGCRERGLSVPEDVAVVGSTGMDVAEFAHPSLSVLAQPMAELGTEAARMLLRRQACGAARVDGVVRPNRLTLRESFTLPPEAREELGVEGGTP